MQAEMETSAPKATASDTTVTVTDPVMQRGPSGAQVCNLLVISDSALFACSRRIATAILHALLALVCDRPWICHVMASDSTS